MDCSGGKLQYRMREQTHRQLPGRHVRPDFENLQFSVEIDHIDRKLHAQAVHRAARNYPYSGSGNKPGSSQKTFPSRCTRIRYFCRMRKNAVTRLVPHQDRLRFCVAVLSKIQTHRDRLRRRCRWSGSRRWRGRRLSGTAILAHTTCNSTAS